MKPVTEILPRLLMGLLLTSAFAAGQDTDKDGIPDATDPNPTVNAVVADPDGNNNLPASLATGLIGRWDAETLIPVGSYHGFADLAGNDQPLECRSLTMSVDNVGMISKAARFDQESDHLSALPSLVSGRTAFSVSMWFKIPANYVQTKATAIHTIFYAYNNGADAYPEFFLSIYKGISGSPTQKIFFNRYVGSGVSTDWYAEIPSTGYVDDNRWHHLTMVKNGANYRLFLDGAKIKDTTGTAGSWTAGTGGYFCFGKGIPNAINAGHTFRGSMDRMRFYSRNLSDTEAIALYEQDSDRDGYWDITEHEWTGTPALSPFLNQGPNADSDGDFLPDAWETDNGLDPLSGTGVNGADGDLDGDGVSNFKEYLNGTNPALADSDGDGASDAVEIGHGGDPNDASDGGQPPSDPIQSVSFTQGGDYTMWRMKIQGTSPGDQRVLYVASKDFDTYTPEPVILRKNNRYEITLEYLRTIPTVVDNWYCWQAQVNGWPSDASFVQAPNNQIGMRINTDKATIIANHWILNNESGLLTTHLHSLGTNVASSKVAVLNPIVFITPAGDPVANPVAALPHPAPIPDGSNEFTFSSEPTGVLLLNYKVSAPGAALLPVSVRNQLNFIADPVGTVSPVWHANNPGGRPEVSGDFLIASATYSGLPASNSAFGSKRAQLNTPTHNLAEKRFEVFFPRDASNHGGGVIDTSNWFHYWQEGDVCGIPSDAIYVPTLPWGGITYPDVDYFVRLGPSAAATGMPSLTLTSSILKPGTSPPETYGTITIGANHSKGILNVAHTVEHELHHIVIYEDQYLKADHDGDGVADVSEASLTGIASSPNHPDTYNLSANASYSTYGSFGDDEIRALKKETSLSFQIFPDKDWANPGCQHFNQHGPTP